MLLNGAVFWGWVVVFRISENSNGARGTLVKTAKHGTASCPTIEKEIVNAVSDRCGSESTSEENMTKQENSEQVTIMDSPCGKQIIWESIPAGWRCTKAIWRDDYGNR